MSTIRFAHPKDKFDSAGKGLIKLIYSIKGQRAFFSTPIKLFPANWDTETQVAIYLDRQKAKKAAPKVPYDKLLTGKEVDEVNTDLRLYEKEIANIEKRFELDKEEYSSQMVIDKLKNIRGKVSLEKKSDDVLGYIEKYIKDHSATRVKGSMTVYKSLKSHLAAMTQQTGIKVTFDGIDYTFMQAFQNFLIEKRNLSNTTVGKQLGTLKTFLNYARKENYKVSDKYKDFKIKAETLEVIALTKDEFQALLDLDFSKNKKLNQVRDAFCFACVTGLRYSDLARLRRENIYSDEIRITVQKTKELLTIPLNSYSYTILKKYRGMLNPIPVISNQKMNAYLKGHTKKDKAGKETYYMGICELARINTPTEIVRYRGVTRVTKTYPKFELVGVHTARKTFVTLSLELGMSAQEIMKITGHKDYKAFQRYLDVSNERKKAVMTKAWGEIPQTKLKEV